MHQTLRKSADLGAGLIASWKLTAINMIPFLFLLLFMAPGKLSLAQKKMGVRGGSVCVCVCVCVREYVCVRACVRACVSGCVRA